MFDESVAIKKVVRTDLQPFEQETQPLANIWCVKIKENTHRPNDLNSQMRVMKTYLEARYRLSDLLRAQRNDRMTSNLKKVDRKWFSGQRRPRGRQLPPSETIFYAERGKVILEQGRDCGLQEKR